MIGVLLLSSSFMIVIFLAMIILIVQQKKWIEHKEKEFSKRQDEIREEVKEIKKLFKGEIAEVLGKIKTLLN